MFDTRTRLSFFACQKDAAGAALHSKTCFTLKDPQLDLMVELGRGELWDSGRKVRSPGGHLMPWQINILAYRYNMINICHGRQLAWTRTEKQLLFRRIFKASIWIFLRNWNHFQELDFLHLIFGIKNSTLVLYEQAKTVSRIFRFREIPDVANIVPVYMYSQNYLSA